MPIVRRIQPQRFGAAPELQLPEPEQGPSFAARFATGATAGAADFGFGSLYTEWRLDQEHPAGPPVPGFNPLEDIEGYEEFADEFVGLNNPEKVARQKHELDLRQRAREDIASTGVAGFLGMMAAGALDPTMLIPGLALERVTVGLGGTLAKAAARGAIIGTGSLAGGAVVTGLTNELYTATEAATQLTAAALLGGVLGGGPAAMRAIRDRGVRRAVAADLGLPAEVGKMAELAGPLERAAGAQVAPLREAVLKNAAGLVTVTEKTKISPYVEAATSPSGETRRAVQELAETNLQYREFDLGVAAPVTVETEVRRLVENADAFAVRELKASYKKYLTRMKGLKVRPISIREFNRQTTRAMRQFDNHMIGEIAAFAKKLRAVVFDPIADRASKAGLLADDVLQLPPKGAVSYLTRIYNVAKINALRDVWVDRVSPWIASRHPELDPAEVRDAAHQIADTLSAGQRGRIHYGKYQIKGARRPTKERSFTIDDAIIEDFLEDDILSIVHYYGKTMTPDTLLTERFGDPQMAGIVGREGRIETEYRRLFEAARQITDPKKRQKRLSKLTNRKQRDLDLIEGMRDVIRGTYGLPQHPDSLGHRTSLAMRRAAVVTRLGGVTISSLPDPGAIVANHGLLRAFGGPIRMLVGRLARAGRAQPNRREDLQAAGVAWEWVLNTRPRSLYDYGDDFGRSTVPERGLAWAADKFGRITGLSAWNNMMKQWTGILTYDRLLTYTERLAAGQKLHRSDVAWLAQNFVDEPMARRVAAMFKTHGGLDEGGLRFANVGVWTDREAAIAVMAAVKRTTDKTIQTPSAGDLPLFLRGQVGSLVGVARSFSFATMNNIALAGLQRKDMAFANGLMMASFLGMGSYAMKSWLAGRELSEDPATWATEGLDRSGFLGILGDVNFALERMSGNRVGLAALSGEAPSKRIGADLGEMLLGIPYSQVNDGGNLIGDLMRGQSPTAKEFQRMAPYGNLWYIQAVLRAIEEGQQ